MRDPRGHYREETPLERPRRFPPGFLVEASPDRPLRLHFDTPRYRQTGEALIRLLFADGTVAHASRVRLTGPSVLGADDPPLDRPTAVCLLRTDAPVEILE